MALAASVVEATLPGMTPDCSIVVRSPADLIAVTPYLLGFHPADSVVVLGLAGHRVIFAARHDLVPPGDQRTDWLGPLAGGDLAKVMAVLGFGPSALVKHTVDILATALARGGLRVQEKLRITDGRWWSCDCTDQTCCPPEGHPVPSPFNPLAATAVFNGQVALPDRQTLVGLVASVEGEERAQMTAATAEVYKKLGTVLALGFHPDNLLERCGRAVVRSVERHYEQRRSLSRDEVAWLGLLLANRKVHDYALDRTLDEEWRVALWTEVTRRVDPHWMPGPATLLGYAAWRAGLGSLARVAVDRALLQDPHHRFARTLDRLLAAGISHKAVEDLTPPVGIYPGGPQ